MHAGRTVYCYREGRQGDAMQCNIYALGYMLPWLGRHEITGRYQVQAASTSLETSVTLASARVSGSGSHVLDRGPSAICYSRDLYADLQEATQPHRHIFHRAQPHGHGRHCTTACFLPPRRP